MLSIKGRISILVCLAVTGRILVMADTTSEANPTTRLERPTVAAAAFANLPMSFELNQGQFDRRVSFMSRGRGYALFLTPTESTFVLRTPSPQKATANDSVKPRRGKDRAHPRKFTESVLRMSLAGANPHAQFEGVDPLPGVVNYFRGNDPKQWRVAIPTFTKVRCQGAYPGVELLYYGNQQRLEYDFVVSPGADPKVIGIRFQGADRVEIDAQGNLVVNIQGGQIHWHKPLAYQTTANGVIEVPSRYVLTGRHQIGFDVGSYDKTQPLVIDPVLVYSTFLGGTDTDYGNGIAVDTSGNVYVTGDVFSTDLPVTNSFDATPNGLNDVFVAKLNSTGTALIYSTYLGGNDDDVPWGIAVDSSGNAYVVGYTISANFPTRNAYQSTFSQFSDAFIAKLGPAGTNLLYSSFLGNTLAGNETAYAVAVDNTGNAYVTGTTDSGRNFRTRNPFQSKAGGYPSSDIGSYDAFVANFNTTISGDASLIYSSWLGGSSDEFGNAIAVDSGNNVYVTGEVDSNAQWPNPPSSDFPTTTGAFQRSFNGGGINGVADAFVTKINAAGSAMVFSTFLGGDGEEVAYAIAVDASNRVYLTGQTSSYYDFPILPNAVQPISYSYYTVFVTALNAAGTSLFYSTYLGGSDIDSGNGIAVDNFGQIYLAGQTSSYDFPVTVGCDQTNIGSVFAPDAFVAKINPNVPGRAGLAYASYFGGGDEELVAALALDASGNWYIVGTSSSTDLPTTSGVFRSTNSGYSDAFVVKFSSPRDLSVANLATNTVVFGNNLTYTLYVNNNGRQSFSGVTVTDQLPTNLQFVTATTTLGNWTQSGGLVTFNLGSMTNNVSAILTITALAVTPGPITNTATVSAVESELNTANNVSAAITGIRGIADMTLALTASPNPVIASSNLTYVIGVTNKGPYPATGVLITNILGSGANLVGGNISQGVASNVAGVVIGDVGTLAVGAGATLTLFVSPVPPGSTITNIATVSTFEMDNSPANNTATAITTVTPLANLALFSSPAGTPDPVYGGSNLTYVVSVTNFGPSIANSVVVTDTLPPFTTYVSASSTLGTCTQTNGVVTCNITALATNAGANITINCKAAGQGLVTNTATVTSAALDLNPANNTVLAVNTVIATVDLAVSMTGLPNPVLVANNLNYTIVVTNRGPSPATVIVLTDTLPANTLFAGAQAAQGSFTQGGGIVTWNLPILAANAAATATITVIPTLEGSLTNVASVTSGVTELNPANNTATTVTTANYNPLAPFLKIARAGTNVVVYWSINAVGFNLQSTTAFGITNTWLAVTNIPVPVGPQLYVTNAPTGTGKYYRLYKANAAPLLSIALLGPNVVISWPASATGFKLQAATTLPAQGLWTDVTNVPVIVGDNYAVTNLPVGPQAYYRLST